MSGRRRRQQPGAAGVGLVILGIAVAGGALLNAINGPPKEPSHEIVNAEGRSEKIVWVNEGGGVASIADTPFKVRKCPDNKFVVEYHGQALSGAQHFERFGSPDDRDATSDGRADSAQAAAKWNYVVRYQFHFYPPHRRVIPIGGDVHPLPVCQQVNDPEDYPADFFPTSLPPTVWQAEPKGVWSFVSKPRIKVHQCARPFHGQMFVVEYDRQTQAWDVFRWSAEDAGEKLSRDLPGRDPIYQAPEFRQPRSALPVCEQGRWDGT